MPPVEKRIVVTAGRSGRIGPNPDGTGGQGAWIVPGDLPIGDSSVAQEQTVRLARAVRDLPAPIWIRSSSGKRPE